jgi:uncharacterized membrane protein (UPF0127 family)
LQLHLELSYSKPFNTRGDQSLRIENRTREALLGNLIEIADTSSKRRTGLLKHASLQPGEGLWIVPCEAVHTFGMQFPIDVLFLSKKRKVLKIRQNMGRRRMALCLRAHSVLELPAGTIAETGTMTGDQLEFIK